MTKRELIETIVEKTDLTKKDTELFLNTFIEVVTETLTDGDKVQITGFGTYSITNIAEREGRNPKTEEKLIIPAHKRVKFKVGKKLKEDVNNK